MDVRAIENYMIRRRRFTIPELQKAFSTGYAETRALVDRFERLDMVEYMSGMDFIVPSSALKSLDEDLVFLSRITLDRFSGASEKEYKALVYAYLHGEIDKREFSRFVGATSEEADQLIYWLKINKVYDSPGKRMLISNDILVYVLDFLEEEKGYHCENALESFFDF